MKFSHHLSRVDQESPAPWRGGYLRYKSLKKYIKFRRRRMQQALPEERSELQITAVHDVIEMLSEQLKLVDKRFAAEARAILAKYDSTTKREGSSLSCILGRVDSKSWSALRARLLWARRFARLNALALRKIAKKHDKALGGQAGHLFLQECWRGQGVVQHFLGGPLHAELAAVQALVSYKAPKDEHELDKTRRRTLDAAVPDDERQGQVAKTLEADMLESSVEDLTCPICMDLMYQPAALACGHTFCGRCCVSAAGHDVADVRTFRDLSYVATRDACCPMCRTRVVAGSSYEGERGVYEAGIELPHVNLLIQQRFPKEWEARRVQEEAEMSQLKPAKRRWFQGTVDVSGALGHRGA